MSSGPPPVRRWVSHRVENSLVNQYFTDVIHVFATGNACCRGASADGTCSYHTMQIVNIQQAKPVSIMYNHVSYSY